MNTFNVYNTQPKLSFFQSSWGVSLCTEKGDKTAGFYGAERSSCSLSEFQLVVLQVEPPSDHKKGMSNPAGWAPPHQSLGARGGARNSAILLRPQVTPKLLVQGPH